jgi:tetratricopeptide (TPR) repeat protein
MDDPLQQGVKAYRTGNKTEARRLLMQAIKENPDDERGWGWLYNAASNDKEREACLRNMLRINPKNEKAQTLLDDLVSLDPPLEKPAVTTLVEQKQEVVSTDTSRTSATNQKNALIGCLALSLVCVVLFFVFGGFGSKEPSTPTEYLKEYGGQQAVYEELLSLNDCMLLQEKFDIAAENNEWETPGTVQHKWTLGYMTAADQRMEEVGCYK